MKKYLFLLIIVSFLAGCGSGGGGSKPAVVDNSNGNTGGYTGGNKVNPECSGTGKIARIKVNEDGIYRAAFPDIYSACSTISTIAISTISMSNQGDEIAIDVVDSNVNGSFDNGDYIEFYGKALGRDDSRFRFTENNVYWLSVGEKTGKRIAYLTTGSPPLPGSSSFEKILHMEEDSWYDQKNYPAVTLPYEVREHWFWGEVFYPQQVAGPDTYLYKRDYPFSTLHIDTSKTVSLKVWLQHVSGSHDTKVYINGYPLPEQVWESEGPYDIVVTSIDPSNFKNSGQNKLTLESVSGGLFYLDWFEVTYYHKYKAEDNFLEFTGGGQIKLSNFTYGDISVYEVSDTADIRKINPTITRLAATGEYEVKFSGNPDGSEHFLALTSSRKKTPSVEIYTPVDIKSKPAGFVADYVIVTHGDFYDAIAPLANYRANEGGGYSVLTVKTSDIYDEFGYGIETQQAIKDFLSYAYNNWATEYVLLTGDATFDYKDISSYGSTHGVKSYVPTYLYNYPGLGEVPSDNWFVDVDNSNGVLPEMNIGRIPAKSPADVAAVINKIKSHELSSLSSNKVLLVADAVENEFGIIAPENEQIFETLSNSVEAIIPADYTVTKNYRRNYSGDFKYRLISEIDGGQLIVNYAGHGSVVDWTKEDLFSSEDVSLLANNDRYPFVVALNCLNGYFVLADDNVEYPDPADSTKKIRQYPSLAETFLLADGKGAVAVWAASAIGYPSEHDPLAQSLYNLIFNENINVLGDAVTEAKKSAYTNNVNLDDVVQTFIFFGDPATRLKNEYSEVQRISH